MQVQENLEVFFCDLCNTSVPQRDIETRVAMRVKDRVFGSCCLAELRGSPPAAPRQPERAAAAPRAGLVATTVVLLAAVAGGAMFLDWRLSEEVVGVHSQVDRVETALREQRERLPELENRLAVVASVGDLKALQQVVDGMAQSLVDRELRMKASLDGATGRIDLLGKELDNVRLGQRDLTTGLTTIGEQIGDLGRDVAAVLAEPRAAPPVDLVSAPALVPGTAGTPTDAGAPGVSLPEELASEVSRLTDSDPGTRFEAVDVLIQSKNAAVLDSLIPMVKDADPFVRRLTVEGLSEFHKAAGVDALITALADVESIVRHAAYSSLRKLTRQDIGFDADAKVDQRRSGQRRWQSWWDKNRDKF